MKSVTTLIKHAVFITLSSAALLATNTVQANHFKVYGAGQPKQNEMEVVYFYDYIAQSKLEYSVVGKPMPDTREGMMGHTLELEYGISDSFAIGFYSDFEAAKGESPRYAQTRGVVSRVKLFKDAERFFDASIYFEYYAPREDYVGGVGDKLEARIILQHQWTDWDLRLNPKFEKVLGGEGNVEPLEFEYATGLYRKVNAGMNVGLEAYGNMGEIAHMRPGEKEHYLVPTLEYNLAPELWINVGVAFGLNEKSDDVALKTYVEFEF